MRRGVLSLRVVLQMRTGPKFYPLIPVIASEAQRHSGVSKVRWEMQQLRRRAGATDC